MSVPVNRIRVAAPIAQNSVGAGDIADDLAHFLITRAPELAREFAAARPIPVDAATLPDWMRAIDAGEIISANDAAMVGSVTAQAIRDRCQRAERDSHPIGRCFAGVW